MAANQEFIREKFGEASRYTPQVIDNYIIARLIEGVVALLHDVARFDFSVR